MLSSTSPAWFFYPLWFLLCIILVWLSSGLKVAGSSDSCVEEQIGSFTGQSSSQRTLTLHNTTGPCAACLAKERWNDTWYALICSECCYIYFTFFFPPSSTSSWRLHQFSLSCSGRGHVCKQYDMLVRENNLFSVTFASNVVQQTPLNNSVTTFTVAIKGLIFLPRLISICKVP